MTRAEISALLACFAIWMRPFVWVQLMLLKRAQMRHRRELMIHVCYATGRLRIVYIADAPQQPSGWQCPVPAVTALDRLALAPPAPACTYVRSTLGLLARIMATASWTKQINPAPP
ncbi:MAG: hypothetical protein V7651_06755 [Hyphomonas oceanitis]|uniref:hypothetical protein n=1 Tax=Hyphomonas oceanitis TaxID=81033 RepID=UPI0030014B51